MENQNNIDNNILNLMLLNPHLSYIQGYTNIYHKNDEINVIGGEGDNTLYNHAFITNQLNNNNNLVNNNNNKIAPSIYNSSVSVNMNQGSSEAFPNNNNNINNGNQSNFHIFNNEGNINNSNINIQEQFQDNNQNSSINTDIIFNQSPININDINLNSINLNEVSEIKPNDSLNLTNSENVLNPIYNLLIQDNNNNSNSKDIDSTFKNILPCLGEEEKNNLKLESYFMGQTIQSLVNISGNEELNPEESKNDEIDNEIEIIFFLKDSKKSYNLKVNPDEIIEDVLSEFLEKYNINNNYIVIYNYDMIDKEKTIRKNHIKDGDQLLLYNISKKKKNSKKEEDVLEIFNYFLVEYKAKKLTEYQIELKKAIKNKTKKPKFETKIDHENLAEFLIKRTKKTPSGIRIREHKHPLVCCLTNNNWICNQCNKKYDCQNEKFCCSFCDYNMCHKCRKLKNYERRKAIKQDITPDNEKYRKKYLITNLHEHKLIYCITSRNYFGESFWNCDICDQKGNNWSFYCTICDFDLCFDCAQKNKK